MTEWDQVLEKCLRHLRYKYVAIQIHCNTNTNTLQYKYVRNSDMSQVAAVADQCSVRNEQDASPLYARMPDTVCCTANRIASHIVQQIGAHLGACKVKCGMRGMPCYHHLPLFKPAVCIPHLYVWHHLTLKDPTYSYCCSYSPSLKSPWLTHYTTANTLSNGQHTNQRLTHYLINDTWVTRPTLAVQFVSFYFLSALNLFLTSLLCFVDRFTSLYAEPGKICMTTGGSLTLLSQGTVCPHHSGGLISS